jgi:hypothetical protein
MYQQPALKGRNPAIDSMPPFQGYGKETAFIHRALPCDIDDRAFSPSPLGVASRYVVLKARLLPCNCQKFCSAPDFCKAGALPLTRRSVDATPSGVFDLAMTVKRAFDTPSTMQ